MAGKHKTRTLVSWSSGKDSAWTLHVLRQQGGWEVEGLVTTMNCAFDRVAMHGTRRELVEQQARAAGVPLWTVPLPWPCSNQQYEQAMAEVCARARGAGVEAIAFGDLFLRDVRAYREQRLRHTGLAPLFPLWERPTAELAREMIAAGLRARVTCLDPKRMPRELAGAEFDLDLLRKLPAEVDACAEKGEFHTFAYAGPMFSQPLAIQTGEVVEREGFVFADLIPAGDCAPITRPSAAASAPSPRVPAGRERRSC